MPPTALERSRTAETASLRVAVASSRVCRRTQHGSVALVVLGVLALVTVLALGLGRLGAAATARARADAVADVTALAAAGAGAARAEQVARSSGATWVQVRHHDDGVHGVRVVVGGVHARAAATASW